jgi:hypothetical protein
MKIGILGYGEIGQTIHKLYDNNTNSKSFQVFIKDLNKDDGFVDLDILNVSIPYNDSFDFLKAVKDVIQTSKTKLAIIHSTVAVGTIRKLKELVPQTAIVHSPCRGVHPNLYEGIMTFPKFVGAPLIEDAAIAVEHLNSLNVKTILCDNSETTELAKLLDTSYYGICIAYHGEAKKACEKFGANFDQVMTTYNQTYNEGYTTLGKSNVVRPVLSAPAGGIGGHCVVENAELLSKQFVSPALDFIVTYKRKK